MSAQLDMAKRATGIGASEIAAILGLSPWTTPLDIYLRKAGLVEESGEGNQYTKWGLMLEPVIAQAYTEETGIELIGDGRETFTHPEYDFALCTPDRIAADRSRVVEIKTTRFTSNDRLAEKWGEPGTDQIPEYYLTQVAWQMAVLDIDVADLAVLIGGSDFRIYTVNRDRELEATLLDVARRFWFDNVLASEPPPPANDEEYGRMLLAKWPKDSGEMIAADEEIESLAAQLRQTKLGIKTLEAEAEATENAIKRRLADNSGCIGTFGKITWKATAERAVIDYKALCNAVPSDLVKSFTTMKPGMRRFLFTPAKEAK